MSASETKTETPTPTEHGTCACRCGTKVGVTARFAPGHDAKLKSRLYKIVRGDDEEAAGRAKSALGVMGWPLPKERKPDAKAGKQRDALANLGF